MTTLLEKDGVTPGGTAHAAVKVVLPEKLHTNSNKPRDKSLIPAVLTITPAEGVAVAEIVYPQASDLKQEGSEQPLSVYEREFLVGVRLNVAASAAPGDITVAGRFRSQACDEKMCYLPVSESIQWKLRVVPAGTAIAAGNAEAFKAIGFGTGRSPAPTGAAAEAATPGAKETLCRRSIGPPAERRRRVSRNQRIPEVHSQRGNRGHRERLVRGAGRRRQFSSSCSSAASRSISRRACCR